MCIFVVGPDHDAANELGHYVTQPSTSSSDIPISFEDGNPTELQQKCWDLNYHEAAIYLQVKTIIDKKKPVR